MQQGSDVLLRLGLPGRRKGFNVFGGIAGLILVMGGGVIVERPEDAPSAARRPFIAQDIQMGRVKYLFIVDRVKMYVRGGVIAFGSSGRPPRKFIEVKLAEEPSVGRRPDTELAVRSGRGFYAKM